MRILGRTYPIQRSSKPIDGYSATILIGYFSHVCFPELFGIWYDGRPGFEWSSPVRKTARLLDSNVVLFMSIQSSIQLLQRKVQLIRCFECSDWIADCQVD